MINKLKKSFIWQEAHIYADLRNQLKSVENSLEERKYLSKATGILMELHGFSEEKAYEKIRTFSMDKRISVLETSKKIIAAYQTKK